MRELGKPGRLCNVMMTYGHYLGCSLKSPPFGQALLLQHECCVFTNDQATITAQANLGENEVYTHVLCLVPTCLTKTTWTFPPGYSYGLIALAIRSCYYWPYLYQLEYRLLPKCTLKCVIIKKTWAWIPATLYCRSQVFKFFMCMNPVTTRMDQFTLEAMLHVIFSVCDGDWSLHIFLLILCDHGFQKLCLALA